LTYDAKEKSDYGGCPVELYKFVHGSQYWFNTDADMDIIAGTDTYQTGYALSRSEPEFSQETCHSELKIQCPMNYPPALLFGQGAPWFPVWISVYRKHRSDTEVVLIWQGQVRNVAWNLSKGTAELSCTPVETSMGKIGFRQSCSPQCNKRLYSVRCGAIEANFTVSGTIATIDSTGTIITSAAFATQPNGFFRLGEAYVQSLNARVQIIAHTGSSITVRRPVTGLAVGLQIRAVAGCDHVWKHADASWGDCHAKFSNRDNFLGYPFVPTKNPYEVGLEG
jgi:uncharacterized phage protein (TIGR02218 family)